MWWSWKTDQTTSGQQWLYTRHPKHQSAKGPLWKLIYLLQRNNAQPATNSKLNPQHALFTSSKMFFICCSVKQSQTIKLTIHHFENSFYKQISTLGPGAYLCYSVMKIWTEHWSGWSASVVSLSQEVSNGQGIMSFFWAIYFTAAKCFRIRVTTRKEERDRFGIIKYLPNYA